MTIYTFPKENIRKIATKQVLALQPLILIILSGSFILANHFNENAFIEDPVLLLIMIGVTVFVIIGGFSLQLKQYLIF